MSTVSLEPPTVNDGLPVWQLVSDTGVLDVNSVYAYCALFRHFPDTCVVARSGGSVAGFITGHRIPARPDALFVWQVGVASSHRGQGLATGMLRYLLRDPELRWLETTVTPSNRASDALFRGLARHLDAPCEVTDGLSAAQLGSGHEPERLYRIGPIPTS